MSSLKILCLEDDPNLSMVMSQYFEDEGHQLTQTDTGQDCLKRIQSEKYDILLMDLGLPDVDGISLIPQIKQIYNGPIIVVSGKSSTTDRVIGLEMGADDYIAKPFEMRELLARIKANVRQNDKIHHQTSSVDTDYNTDSSIYTFADFSYDISRLHLEHSQKGVIELTSGEYELLNVFIKSNGRVLTREYLHEQTRHNAYESFDRAVDIAVTRLRKKIEDDPSNPHIIKTVRGVGYMFVIKIEKSSAA